MLQIVFVGGNETQMRFTRDLKPLLLEEGIDVTFIHPGFCRNWNKPLAKFERALPAEGVVITNDLPTLLEKHVLRACRRAGLDAVHRHARGRASVLRAIREAADRWRRRRNVG